MMTDPAPTAAERCTTVLLQNILDYLWLPDVLRAMGVNRLWREHALNHPTYYGELYLFERDPPEAADAFFLRLSRSHGRPVLAHLHRDDLRPFMPQISNHLAHIRSLTLRQCAEHPFSPILEALCRPADILSYLALEYMPGSEQPDPEWMLPHDFLADHAPELEWVILTNVAFSYSLPRCFSHVLRLGFGSRGRCRTTFMLPDPFKRCPNLDELNLSGCVTLADSVCLSQHVWGRLSRLTFLGHPVAARWPTFRIPIAAVSRINVTNGDAESALALASSLSGELKVTFLPLERTMTVTSSGDVQPFVFYTAILSSFSDLGNRSRLLDDLLTAQGSISAFSKPFLADRVVRLDLPLEAWVDLVGLGTFGPFNALEELVITLDSECAFEEAAPTKLFCPRLLRLVLSAEQHITADTGIVASFALAALPATRFPLRLETDGVGLTGSWKDCPETFNVIAAPNGAPHTLL